MIEPNSKALCELRSACLFAGFSEIPEERFSESRKKQIASQGVLWYDNLE